MEDQGQLAEFVRHCLWVEKGLALSPVINFISLFWGRGMWGYPYKPMSRFQANGGGQRACLISALPPLPSVQKNPYARVAYFWVAYSATRH